jgi:hypothetical protein
MYLFASSLAAAALDGLFDPPARGSEIVRDPSPSQLSQVLEQFFNSLLASFVSHPQFM